MSTHKQLTSKEREGVGKEGRRKRSAGEGRQGEGEELGACFGHISLLRSQKGVRQELILGFWHVPDAMAVSKSSNSDGNSVL